MTQEKSPKELESVNADLEKAIAEANDVLAEAESTMDNLEVLNQKLIASNGDLEELLPSKLYSEDERTSFVDALSEFVGGAKEWLSGDGAKASEKTDSSKKKSPRGNKKRGFAV